MAKVKNTIKNNTGKKRAPSTKKSKPKSKVTNPKGNYNAKQLTLASIAQGLRPGNRPVSQNKRKKAK